MNRDASKPGQVRKIEESSYAGIQIKEKILPQKSRQIARPRPNRPKFSRINGSTTHETQKGWGKRSTKPCIHTSAAGRSVSIRSSHGNDVSSMFKGSFDESNRSLKSTITDTVCQKSTLRPRGSKHDQPRASEHAEDTLLSEATTHRLSLSSFVHYSSLVRENAHEIERSDTPSRRSNIDTLQLGSHLSSPRNYFSGSDLSIGSAELSEQPPPYHVAILFGASGQQNRSGLISSPKAFMSPTIANHSSARIEDTVSAINGYSDHAKSHDDVQNQILHAKDVPQADLSSFHDAWRQISLSRNYIATLRENARILRSRLRELDDQKSLADDAYFKHVQIREFCTKVARQPLVNHTLKELLRNCRNIRDEFGPLEDEYTQLENELSSQEYQLTYKEEEFYRRWTNNFTTMPSHMDAPTCLVTSHDTQNFSQQFHPLAEAYLSQLGNLDSLREQYDDILDERSKLQGELTSRQRVGLKLMAEDQSWLDSSQDLLDELGMEISATEVEESELRQKCLSLGLVDENGDPIETRASESLEPQATEAEAEYVQPLNTLPPIPTKMTVSSKVVGCDASFDLNERFDRWMLDRLRGSLFEVGVYACCFPKSHPRNPFQLESDIHTQNFEIGWFNDGFTKSALDRVGVYTSSTSSQRVSIPELSFVSTTYSETGHQHGVSPRASIQDHQSEHSDKTESIPLYTFPSYLAVQSFSK